MKIVRKLPHWSCVFSACHMGCLIFSTMYDSRVLISLGYHMSFNCRFLPWRRWLHYIFIYTYKLEPCSFSQWGLHIICNPERLVSLSVWFAIFGTFCCCGKMAKILHELRYMRDPSYEDEVFKRTFSTADFTRFRRLPPVWTTHPSLTNKIDSLHSA